MKSKLYYASPELPLNSASHTLQPTTQKLLFINITVSAFILLANGSALFLGLTGKAPEVLTGFWEIIFIITGAAVVLSTTILAIIKPHYQEKVLSIHAALLTTGAIMLLLWGLSIAFQASTSLVDLVEQTKVNMTWSVGWLTAIASYSAFLVSITFFKHIRDRSIVVRYAYLWAGITVFFIDVFVFFRLAIPIMHLT